MKKYFNNDIELNLNGKKLNLIANNSKTITEKEKYGFYIKKNKTLKIDGTTKGSEIEHNELLQKKFWLFNVYGEKIAYTINWNKEVSNFNEEAITIENGIIETLTNKGNNIFELVVKTEKYGEQKVYVEANRCVDNIGNRNSKSNISIVRINNSVDSKSDELHSDKPQNENSQKKDAQNEEKLDNEKNNIYEKSDEIKVVFSDKNDEEKEIYTKEKVERNTQILNSKLPQTGVIPSILITVIATISIVGVNFFIYKKNKEN